MVKVSALHIACDVGNASRLDARIHTHVVGEPNLDMAAGKPSKMARYHMPLKDPSLDDDDNLSKPKAYPENGISADKRIAGVGSTEGSAPDLNSKVFAKNVSAEVHLGIAKAEKIPMKEDGIHLPNDSDEGIHKTAAIVIGH